MSRGPRIAVVGAGIIGSAIALALAARGARVTMVDAGGERASENSFGWINANWFNRPDYFRLRHFPMGAWRRWRRMNCWTARKRRCSRRSGRTG